MADFQDLKKLTSNFYQIPRISRITSCLAIASLLSCLSACSLSHNQRSKAKAVPLNPDTQKTDLKFYTNFTKLRLPE